MSRKDLKKLRAELDDVKKRGRQALDEFNTLSAKEQRSDAEDQKLASLNAELDTLETKAEELRKDVDALEQQSRRASLFQGGVSRPAMSTMVSYPQVDPRGGFRSLAEFANAVRTHAVAHEMDPRLQAALPANSHTSSGASGEGHMIPMEFRQEIWSMVFSAGDFIEAVNPEPTASNRVGIIKDESTPWGASGVQAYWAAEAAQMSASKIATKGAQIDLHKLYAFVIATDELLQDGPLLASRLTRSAASAIRYVASEAIMNGNGVGKPLGFMNSGALVTVAKETSQVADTIVATNIAKMFSRLLPQNLANAMWAANSDTLPQLMTLTIGNQPIWTPPNAGFANAPGGFLLGRPIMFSEHCSTLGDLGDLVLVDPSGYAAATKDGGGIDFASSIHLYFDHGAQAFRWTFRIGGQPYLSAPVSPAKGTSTKSHFVALAERA